MIINMYAIRDKFNGFLTPTCSVNDEVAKRDFAYAINNNPGIMNFKPGDFDLYRIGTYDSDKGILKAVHPTVFVCKGVEVITSEKSERESK